MNGTEEATLEVTMATNRHRQYRRDRWHTSCNDPKQQAKVFRYVRQGPVLHRAPPAVGWNGHPPGKASQLAEVDDWWWQLWKPAEIHIQPERWMAALDHLPKFPPIVPITGIELGHVIRKALASKAPGRDGWTYNDIKLLPPAALDLWRPFLGWLRSLVHGRPTLPSASLRCCPKAVVMRQTTNAPLSC